MPLRDVLGHDAVKIALRSGLERGTLPHAMLFVGRRGVGKRRVAQALATARFCATPLDLDGCGACATCTAAESLQHADIELLERAPGKRDIGIASVRALQDALHLTARSGRGRFAIVDGAERLTEDAQNAFLKTLEEPPAGSTIVLIATSPERLLPTIRSRCAVFRFGPLRDEELVEFGKSRRIDESVTPRSIARGSPGVWLESIREPNPDARRLVLDLLCDPSLSPFRFAAELVELSDFEEPEIDELPERPRDAPKNLREVEEAEVVSDTSEVGRRRLLDWLLLLEWGLRDLALAASCADASKLKEKAIHADRANELFAASRRCSDGAYLVAHEALERARADLSRNVDRTLALEALGFEVRRAATVA